MVSLTFSLNDELFFLLQKFLWVNWSEVAREKLNKKRIFEKFIKTGILSGKDQTYCDKLGWYPIDELQLNEEYVKKLKGIVKGSHSKSINSEELDEWFDRL